MRAFCIKGVHGSENEDKTWDPVKFLNLRFNVGGCYDIKTACFVCDVNGLYFFGTALASYNDSRNFEFYITKKEEDDEYWIAEGRGGLNNKNRTTGTISVVCPLQKG